MSRLVFLGILLLLPVGQLCAQRSADEYFRIAKHRFDQGDLEQALQYCRYSTEADTGHISAWLLGAEIDYALGNYTSTIAQIHKAFQLDEHQGKFLADYHVLLARALACNNEYERALEALEHTLNIRNSDPEVYHERAEVYTRLGRSREAVQDLDKAVALAPNAAKYYASRALTRWEQFRPATETESYGKILSDMDIAIALRPDMFDYHHQKCRILQQTPGMDPAYLLDEYDYLIRLFPREPKAYLERGLLYIKEEEYGQALQDLSASIDLGLQDPDCYRYRALCYHNMYQYNRALADFSRAIELLQQQITRSDNTRQGEFVLSETYFLRGISYLQEKKGNDACIDFEKAYVLGSKKAYNYYRKYCNIF